MSSVYIVSACRSPIGNLKGQFSELSVNDLTVPVLQAVVDRSGLNATEINEIYLGNVLSAGKGQNPARQAAVMADLPIEAPATTINMLCGSGLKAVALGYNSIKAGNSNVVLCGGMESMSQAEHTIYMRTGSKIGDCTLKDSMINDGLTDAMNNVHMGETAENVAIMYGISRTAQDEFALRSQQKAANAIEKNYFAEEIVSVRVGDKLISRDEYPRPKTSMESLAKLRPAFVKVNGTVTAGNASGINDGAAAVILSDSKKIKQHNLIPLARIIDYAEAGMDPLLMGVAPINAIRKLMAKNHWSICDVDLFEINEAFASQSIAIMKELHLDPAKVNVSGGAIALGHPIGASGARVLVTLFYNLKRLNLKRGICGLCIGGGMAIAMAIENCYYIK